MKSHLSKLIISISFLIAIFSACKKQSLRHENFSLGKQQSSANNIANFTITPKLGKNLKTLDNNTQYCSGTIEFDAYFTFTGPDNVGELFRQFFYQDLANNLSQEYGTTSFSITWGKIDYSGPNDLLSEAMPIFQEAVAQAEVQSGIMDLNFPNGYGLFTYGQCSPGGGNGSDSSGTGTGENQDIIDSLKKFPCASSLLQQLPQLNNTISTLINNTFGSNSNFNIIFVAAQIPQPAGQVIDGDHIVDSIHFNNGYNFDAGFTLTSHIRINEDVLNYATKEYILATMYHEALHAFLNVEQDRLGAQFNTVYPGMNLTALGNNYFDINTSLFQPGHEIMGVNFADQLAAAILSYNPNLSPAVANAIATAGIFNHSPTDQSVIYNTAERDTRQQGYQGTKCP